MLICEAIIAVLTSAVDGASKLCLVVLFTVSGQAPCSGAKRRDEVIDEVSAENVEVSYTVSPEGGTTGGGSVLDWTVLLEFILFPQFGQSESQSKKVSQLDS